LAITATIMQGIIVPTKKMDIILLLRKNYSKK